MKEKFQKYLEGTASSDEQRDILSLIESSDDIMKEFLNYKEEWKSGNQKLITLSTWNAWKKIEGEINPGFIIKRQRMFAIASVLLVLVCSSLWLLINMSKYNDLTIQTKAGQLTRVILPDSTEVNMNSATHLTFSSGLFGLTRNVKLNGEAYFHVHHKAFSEFNVICNDVKVNVIGTRFNVKGYDNENIDVVLEEGSVTLSLRNNNDYKQYMKPGEMVSYNALSNQLTKKVVDTEDFVSWKDGVLYFENNKLPDLLKSLEKRFGVKFKPIEDPVLKEFTITFTIRNEKLEQVLDMIRSALPVNIKTEGEMIIIELDKKRYKNMK